METTLPPQNNQFLCENRDDHLVLHNMGQRHKIYGGTKDENMLKKTQQNISRIHADNMENDKIACLYLKFAKD